jgi:signal transduction histidine kinase
MNLLNSIRKRFPQTLSKKLIALFLIMALVFLFIVGASLGHFIKHHFEHRIKPHLFQYLEYVRNDIGVPADHQKAKALADKLSIDIVIIDQSGVWTSNAQPVDVRAMEVDHQHMVNGVEYAEAEIGKKEYASMAVGDTRFLFDLSQIKHKRERPRALMPLGFLLLILFVLYYATRKLFAPIIIIQEGVKQIGLGKLDHRIEVKRNDELGVLADDINCMAEELQKMLDAKRQLLLAVSHELRSPLTRANVAVAMLGDNDLTRQIKDDIQEMEALISDILETERLSTQHHVLEKESQVMNDLCREVIADYFPHDSLVLQLPDTNVIAVVDQSRIRLLLKNIIGNALRYQRDLTTVSLSVQGDELLITVTDDGSGVAASDIPHLTEPFYRVDPARQRQTGGYGLGLYLCKVIADAHGGELVIQSQQGNQQGVPQGSGTQVRVILPLSDC